MGFLLALALSLTAHAGGELVVKRKGAGAAYVFVDGDRVGRVTRKQAVKRALPSGRHVVWVSPDKDAFRGFCAGAVEVSEGQSARVVLGPKNRCTGLLGGGRFGPPSRGARLRVVGQEGHVQVDGRDAGFVGWARFLDVSPGSHVIRVTDDLMGRQLRCAGSVQVARHEVAVVTVDREGGCTGLTEPKP